MVDRDSRVDSSENADEIANTFAVRREVLREIVQLRTEDYVRAGKLEELAGLGIAKRVAEHLEEKYDLTTIDPRSEGVRAAIARAITLAAVKPITWVIIRQLAAAGEFPSHGMITYEFREGCGTKHGGGTMVFSLAEEFLFFKPIAYWDLTHARVNPIVLELAEESSNTKDWIVERFIVGDAAQSQQIWKQMSKTH